MGEKKSIFWERLVQQITRPNILYPAATEIVTAVCNNMYILQQNMQLLQKITENHRTMKHAFIA